MRPAFKTKLVILGDYSDNQDGYDQAYTDGALHFVALNKGVSTSLFNIAATVEAVCTCTGSTVAMGLVKEGKYLPVDSLLLSKPDTYFDLDSAFTAALDLNRQILRDNANEALHMLSNSFSENSTSADVDECAIVDHCIECLEQHNTIKIKG